MMHNFISLLNWAISKDVPLHQALTGLAGKRVRIVFPVGGTVDWEIEADGLLREVGLKTRFSSVRTNDSDAPPKAPDVTIKIQADVSKGVHIEGDAMVAEKLGPLARLIKERLSPWERFWSQSMAGTIARQVADYAVHEAGAAVGKSQSDAHHQALRQFRDALDRLEKRIDALGGSARR
jgi:ubiquinone biosynthesis protein UbiJ